MDIRDYLTILRRGALTIIAAIVVAGLLALAYLHVTPKAYQASATLLVTADNPQSITELQLGQAYAQSSAQTIATLIGTQSVLGPATQDLQAEGVGARQSAASLSGSVFATRQDSSSIIVITANAADGETAAALANAVARRASTDLPSALSQRRRAAPLLELQTVQPAIAPSRPLSPAARRVAALFLAVGLALGLGATLLRQSLDVRLRRPDDVTGMTQVPLLASLVSEGRGSRGVLVRDSPASPAMEGYRILRTNLSAVGDRSRNSVMVSSVVDHPSTGVVSVNLAWSMAQTGQRVLLVDLDLRHSNAAALLVDETSQGATAVLDGQEPLSVITSTSLATLDVVSPGAILEAAPSDLLSGPGLARMLAAYEKEYQYVVVHAPGLLSYSDAAIIARVVGHTVLVVRGGQTRGPDLTRALGVLANVGVAPLGIVLSEAKEASADTARQRETRPARRGARPS